MFIGASALVGVLGEEIDKRELSEKIKAAGVRFTSPLAVYEATLALARLGNTTSALVGPVINDFMRNLGVRTISITPEVGRLAIDAFARFGRGHHPARLNMGDCFAYACARNLGVPLLCKGGDFAQTDIELA
jgi:ribonuclease VapC